MSRKKSRKSSTATKILLALGVLLLVSAAFCAVPLVVDQSESDEWIRIPRGSTEAHLRDTLLAHYPEGYAESVLRGVKVSGVDLSRRHGAYLIPAGTSAAVAAHRLTKGAQTPVKLVITGSRTLEDLAGKISRRLDFPADELVRTALDSAANYGLKGEEAIGLFLEDTYEVWWSATPGDIVRKVGANYRRVWNDERQSKATALGLTPGEVETLCSIVDEETNAKSEKGKVARLYLNRLEKGMRLQADPTARYAAGDFTIKRITAKETTLDSPYNTYRVTGLPPGPIRTTSVATIDAALNSDKHDFIYMCAKEDLSGTHRFAADYATHQANARRYQAALDSLGITKSKTGN